MCLIWLERHLHADGFPCPHWGGTERRLFRAPGQFPAYRGRACEGSDTLLTGTVFDKTRQRPATLVLLRGMAQGEPTARLAREVGLSRTQLHTLRQRIQTNPNDTAPTDVMAGPAFAADERYHNAGEPKHAASRAHCSTASTRPCAQGARPLCPRSSPIISLIARDTGAPRWWGCDHANRQTGHSLMADHVPPGSTWL